MAFVPLPTIESLVDTMPLTTATPPSSIDAFANAYETSALSGAAGPAPCKAAPPGNTNAADGCAAVGIDTAMVDRSSPSPATLPTTRLDAGKTLPAGALHPSSDT